MSDETGRMPTEADALEPGRRLFALERARGASVAASARVAGVTRQTGSAWDAEPGVVAAVRALQAQRYADPRAWLDELTPEAVAGLRRGVRAGAAWAILDVLDRRYGRATQRVEATGKDGGPIETVSRDDLVGRVLKLAARAEGG